MKNMSYKSSGVDIDKANNFVQAIQLSVKKTFNNSVLQRKGAFAGLFSLAQDIYKNPVLVSSTDGVGTKLLLAKQLNCHDTVGIDLVAMNVNDILCVGAKPLFFLDYIACGTLEASILEKVVKGVSDGCIESGCALIGGETAEMPGMYKDDDYDLAGFAVGIVEEDKIIDGASIAEGDCLIGLPSSGLHSNGFSLARKVFNPEEQTKRKEELLKPTRIYTKEVSLLLKNIPVKGLAHITGGAFYEKLTKVLPKGLCFSIDKSSWNVPQIFLDIQKKGNVLDEEMYKTFNMGIGLGIVVNSKVADEVKELFKKESIECFFIGKVVCDEKCRVVFEN